MALGLLAMDLVILNLDQVSRMTPELAVLSSNYLIIPRAVIIKLCSSEPWAGQALEVLPPQTKMENAAPLSKAKNYN
ncbi:hypothetical protein TNCV_450621 [Trichonephila clavipes]|nr:hypothetical protein TNCV_450621 [Trichonephila clavipes]